MGSIRPVTKHFVNIFNKTCNIRVTLCQLKVMLSINGLFYSDNKRTTFFAIVCFLSFFPTLCVLVEHNCIWLGFNERSIVMFINFLDL